MVGVDTLISSFPSCIFPLMPRGMLVTFPANLVFVISSMQVLMSFFKFGPG